MPNLSFGQYNIINDNIIEIISDEGVELDLPEAKECTDLYSTFDHPLGVLVNRSNSYSSTLEFALSVAQAPNLSAFAIWVPTERAAIIADSQKIFFDIPFQRFFEKESALNWLKQSLR